MKHKDNEPNVNMEPAPKKRGRPRKNPEAPVSAETAAPKKRGRPRKNPEAPVEQKKTVESVKEEPAKEEPSNVETESARVDIPKQKIRVMMDSVYDIQKLRIAAGNRLVASFKELAEASHTREENNAKIIHAAKSGKAVDTEDEVDSSEEDKENQQMIKTILADYRLITDYFADTAKVHRPSERDIEKAISVIGGKDELKIIRSAYDYQIASTYMDLLETEKNATAALGKQVEKHPMWGAFFKDVKGCGVLMAAVCIGYFDIYKARHISSFWRYAGLDVVDGEGRGRKHCEMREYVSRNGEVKEKKSITFNPIVKTKLIGVLGSWFVMYGAGGKYNTIYKDYKNRLQNRAVPEGKEPLTKGHIHNMAKRYMIKMFLMDMWLAWRKLEGLPIEEPYSVAYLGRNPHGYNAATGEISA